MDLTSKRVAIIIPAYNVVKYFYKCIDSLKSQTHTNFECYIVDDCSTDGTWDKILDVVSNDNRFKAFRNTQNVGCGLSRRRAINLALEHSDAQWLSFIDADDYVHPNFLTAMLWACCMYDTEVAICGTMNRDENYNYLGQDLAEKDYVIKKEDLYKEYMLSSWIKQYNGNKIYARRVIEAVEYSGLRYCEDSMTTYKWLWEANAAMVLPQSLYNYVHHADSNSNKGNEPLQKAIDTCICVYDHYKFCKEHDFDYMYDRLKYFIAPHLLFAVSALNEGDEMYETIKDIRQNML